MKPNSPLPSEAEILAMPEEDYMGPMQLAFFHDRLSQELWRFKAQAEETIQRLREVENVADPADRATLEEEYARELKTRDRESRLIQRIEEALDRIESGDYGYCEETGEPVGLRRLLARPTASLSLEAQTRREQLKKSLAIEPMADKNPIPSTYLQWRHCITVECGIPLTAEFVAQRIASLSRPGSEETLRFRKLYGDGHWRQVLAWFQQAADELAGFAYSESRRD